MKRTFKLEIDVKFAAVTLFLSALVIFMVYIFSSSSVFAEGADYVVGEYIDEFATEATTTAAATTKANTQTAVQAAQVFPTVEAAKVGTASDPLITLSYLQSVAMPQIESSILSKLTGTVTQQSNNNAAAQTSGGSYVVLELTRGQTVTAKTESIEIIVRPGTAANALSPFSDQGLADLTDGTELLNGTGLPINHNLLVPRNDGRGILITSSKAYIMVRGDYEIQ